MNVRKGIATSRGVAIGTVKIADEYLHWEVPFHRIAEEDIEHEIARFRDAVDKVRRDLERNIEKAAAQTGADVFAVHLLITQDEAFCNGVIQRIREKKQNVESLLKEVVDEFSRMFSSLDDPYAREKASDIRDVGQRVLQKLLFLDTPRPEDKRAERHIVVAQDLTPSVTVHLHHEAVLGFMSERGSATSHGSILARSLGVPAVVNLPNLRRELANGDEVIVDGIEGKVFIKPTADIKEQYRHALEHFQQTEEERLKTVNLPAITTDGVEITLRSNIGNIVDQELSARYGADGVGLYRTEFPFLELDRLPTEEEQFEAYKKIIEGNTVVNLRVLDIGGDKFLPYLSLPEQSNPYLGWRGLRVLFENMGIFRSQIRAVLRASVFGRVNILLPMVASIEEIRRANQVIAEEKAHLQETGKAVAEGTAVGVMIEVPSSIFIIEQILEEVDFVSVGTNDLIQYLLAVDRGQGTVSELYEPLHPAVLHALKTILDAAARHGKPVTICGEMAGVPEYIGILIGLGARCLSVTPRSIPLVKETIRKIIVKNCTQTASRLIQLSTANEIKESIIANCRCGCCNKITGRTAPVIEVT